MCVFILLYLFIHRYAILFVPNAAYTLLATEAYLSSTASMRWVEVVISQLSENHPTNVSVEGLVFILHDTFHFFKTIIILY